LKQVFCLHFNARNGFITKGEGQSPLATEEGRSHSRIPSRTSHQLPSHLQLIPIPTGETAQRDRGARVHPPCWLHRRSSQGVYAKRSPLRLALISFFLFLCSVRSSSKFLIWPRRRTPTTTSSSYATRCARRHSSLSFSHTKPNPLSRARPSSLSSLSPWHPETHAHVLVGEHRRRSSMWSSASSRTWPRS